MIYFYYMIATIIPSLTANFCSSLFQVHGWLVVYTRLSWPDTPYHLFTLMNIIPKRRTQSCSESKEKTAATAARRSDPPSQVRSSPRNLSPLGSPSSTPHTPQSQSPLPLAGSPMGKFFPDHVTDLGESGHETSEIDITGKQVGKDLVGNVNEASGSDPNKQKRSVKSCPCGKSSGGKSWLLKCVGCGQNWHNTCSNLKGQIPKSVIGSLDHWLCPWCFVCPYQPPRGHRSVKQSTSLSTSVISDSIVTQIEEAVKSCISSQNDELIKSIKSSLSTLADEVRQFKGQIKNVNPVQNHDHVTDSLIESIMDDGPNASVPEQPYSAYEPEFISEEHAQELIQFLDQETFQTEGKREVASYGEKYKYMGSKSHDTKPIPEVFQSLIGKLNENSGYKLNQILVNKYSGPDALLPKHSDNEYDINPDSEIHTVSIGHSATVKFTSNTTPDLVELSVDNRSMYSMTRSSQNFYKHQIDVNPNNSVRYSITLRSIHWTYLNSLYAVGDSNFGKIQFGEGKGKVGKSTPGKRDWAATVSDIDPSKSMSYKNVVSMVGTNDLKLPNCDVVKTYQKYKGKLEKMRELNPRCNIFVCPVLPSRSHNINRKIFQFNRLLFDDLVKSVNVNLVRGLGEFLDHGNLLRTKFHDQRTNEDVLHINDHGYRILVRCIKHAIFSSKSQTSNTGRTYATVSRPG